MSIRRLEKGKALKIRAADWNRIADTVESIGQVGGAPGSSAISQTVCYVRNDSDTAVDRGEVLGIAGPLIDYDENADEFMLRPTFSGVAPADPDHVGLFVIALEPLAPPDPEADPPVDGEIGRCVIAGVTLARVAMRVDGSGDPIGDRYADIQDGEFRLRSGSAGAVRILTVSEVDGDDAWCIVSLERNDAGFELAEVQSVSTSTLTCKWLDGEGVATGSSFAVNVYSYTDEDDTTIGDVDLTTSPPTGFPNFVTGNLIRVYRQPRTEWNGTAWVNGYWAVDRVTRICEAT